MDKNKINYRELAEAYSLNATEQGISATRVFVYDGEAYTGPGIGTFHADIPTIGDYFFSNTTTNIPKITCRSIRKKYFGDDIRKWSLTCSYSSEPFDTTSFYKAANMPTVRKLTDRPFSVEFGGDFQVLQPVLESGTPIDWNWRYADGTRVNEPIPFRVVTAKIKINKIIKDSDEENSQGGYGAYLIDILQNLGRINGNLKVPTAAGNTISTLDPIGKSSNMFQNYPGCWLFSDFAASSYFNWEDKKMWKCELTFEFRSPSLSKVSGIFSGFPTYGWLRILRNNGLWDIPYYFKGDKKCFIYAQTYDTGFSSIINF